MANPELTREIEELRVIVERAKGVIDSAVALIGGFAGLLADLKAQLEATGATPEQIALVDELANQIDAKASELATAVNANK